jgi:uncharacterized membrane protein YjdF
MNKKIGNIIDNILRLIVIILIIIKCINGEYSDIGMLLVTFILTFYNWALTNILKINLNNTSRVMIVILIFIAQCLGTTLKFYNSYDNWDLIVHFFSGIVMFMVGYNIISSYNNQHHDVKLNKKLMIIFSILFALSVGSVWEMYEYSVDGILNLDTQRTGQLVGRLAIEDTMTDIFASTLGALLSVFAFLIVTKEEKE